MGVVAIEVHEPLARRATALLTAIAEGDTSAVPLYDALLFPVLLEVALRRGRLLAASAAAKLGVSTGAVADVRSADLDEVATVAAEIALTRARASALRFDATLGDGASWALGALGMAYLDAARDLARSRRLLVEVPFEDELADLPAPATGHADPAQLAEARDGLEWALGRLSDEERYVVVAKLHYGLSYREIALYLLHDATLTKRVDKLLQSARAKLEAAHAEWIAEA